MSGLKDVANYTSIPHIKIWFTVCQWCSDARVMVGIPDQKDFSCSRCGRELWCYTASIPIPQEERQ